MRLLERRLTAGAIVCGDRKDHHASHGVVHRSTSSSVADGKLETITSISIQNGDLGAEQVASTLQEAKVESSAAKLMRQQQQQQTTTTKTTGVTSSSRFQLKRQLNAINSLAAIRLKMLLFGSFAAALVAVSCFLACQLQLAEAGFYTFYFPNVFKPKGFGELSDMIKSLDNQIRATKDAFADTQYFWGQLERLDRVKSDYPEESACSEVFPLFRELAINYIHIDYDFYIKPTELYKDYLTDFREKWYPAGLESKAALPRDWEQRLMEKELDLKIEWLGKLTAGEEYRKKRAQMLEIWKSVRRSLDTSLPCIYLRYAYRQIAEDINQVALENNLTGMQEAMKVLVSAYKRIDKLQKSDDKIKAEIEDELEKIERFTIRS